MIIDFSRQPLPPIYKRDGKDCYLDPIRNKLIIITPEETVRQQVISYLLTTLQVPKDMIDVESYLGHYGIKSSRRSDILIKSYDAKTNTASPFCVIECKAPGIQIDDKIREQMFDYSDKLYCVYTVMTNGYDVHCYRYDNKTNAHVLIANLPSYSEMLGGKYEPMPEPIVFDRLRFDELEDNWDAYIGGGFGEDIPRKLAVPMTNLWECLIYPEHKLPARKYTLFTVIKDMGLRQMTYGNRAGGSYSGVYRSFLIDYKGSTEIVSVGMSGFFTYSKSNINKTALLVAIDTKDSAHHALQYCVDDNLGVSASRVVFYHNGRIAVGNKGSGSVAELRKYIEKIYPQIISRDRFNIGTLMNDHLWNLDEEDMMAFMENLISYALIRDEYRKMVKGR